MHLAQDDRAVLENALRIASETNKEVFVFDVSRMTDKLKAMKRGVKKTPSTIINGKRCEGAEEILKVSHSISSKPNV